jgi:hypothetical protein
LVQVASQVAKVVDELSQAGNGSDTRMAGGGQSNNGRSRRTRTGAKANLDNVPSTLEEKPGDKEY